MWSIGLVTNKICCGGLLGFESESCSSSGGKSENQICWLDLVAVDLAYGQLNVIKVTAKMLKVLASTL